jgi:cytochrome c oxidase assembly protein subunit 15
MVSSGLEVRTSVSQYRLAIHLGTALLLLVAMLWIALEYLRGSVGKTNANRAFVFAGVVYLQMLLGALVAGLHAGLIYNTWPDMNGHVLPEDPFYLQPWWVNFFENPGLAQFDHRIGAYVVAVFAAFMYIRGTKPGGLAKVSANTIAIVATLQICLGITTLMLQAPEWLAAAHQVIAACLLCAAVWHAFELKLSDYDIA